MRAELRLSPAGSGASFAPKTFTFDRPATIELDGHAPGLDFLPTPASKNAILPSFALVIDQAFVHYDGTSFTLKSVPWHSDSVCVNGKLLGDKVHKLKDGDKLLFGTYLKPGFDIECAVRVHLFFPTPPERAPTTTNWSGVHKLLDGIRKEQAHPRTSRQSDPAPPSSPMPSSSSASRPASTPTKNYGDVIHELRLRVPAMDSSLVAPSATSSPSPSSLRHSEPPHPHVGPIVAKIPTSVSTSVLVPAPSVPVPSTAFTRPPCHSSCESPRIAPDHSGIRDGSGPSIPDSLDLAIDRIHSAWIEARRCLLHL